MISVVVLTHNRLALLRRCVEDVLLRTSEKTRELIIWDNASEDGTRGYLDTLKDARINVVHHAENIGTNAYAHAFALATQDYLVELDDDVIDTSFAVLSNAGVLPSTLTSDCVGNDSNFSSTFPYLAAPN